MVAGAGGGRRGRTTAPWVQRGAARRAGRLPGDAALRGLRGRPRGSAVGGGGGVAVGVPPLPPPAPSPRRSPRFTPKARSVRPAENRARPLPRRATSSLALTYGWGSPRPGRRAAVGGAPRAPVAPVAAAAAAGALLASFPPARRSLATQTPGKEVPARRDPALAFLSPFLVGTGKNILFQRKQRG